MFGTISQAAGYGFAAGTSPGPLQSYIISTTLTYGWRRGLIVITSPLITDLPIIYLMVFVLLDRMPAEAIQLIQIAGGLFVLWLAWQTWRSVRAGVSIGDNAERLHISRRRTLLQAILMNFLSPGPYIFWGTVTGPLLRQALDRSLTQGLAMLAAFYITFLVMLALLVLTFDRLRRFDVRVTQAILSVTVVVLAVLGLILIREGLIG